LDVTPKKEVYKGALPTPAGEVKVEQRFDEAEPVVRFWRVVEYREKRETETQSDEPLWLREAVAFSSEEVRADYSRPVPSKLPLLPWSRMWPFLFGILGYYCDTRFIDMDRAVEMAARAEPMNRLPLRQRLTWAGTCQLILDLDERLLPFWDDETDLLQRIEKMRGSSGLEVLVFEYGPGGPCRRWGKQLGEPGPYRLPMPGSPILVISDLGCLDLEEKNNKNYQKLLRGVQGAPRRGEPIRGGIVSEDVFFSTTSTWNLNMPPLAEKRPPGSRRQKAWQRFGRRLKRAGFSPTALTLCPPRCWIMEMTRYWRLASWDKGERLPRRVDRHWSGARPHPGLIGDSEPGTERLLGLLSAAIRVEPALLRAVRLMMPRWQADVGTEADAWAHKNVHPSPIAFAFDKNTNAHYRDLFRNNPGTLKECVLACIKKHHAHLSPAVQAEENLVGTTLMEKDTETSWGNQFMKRVVKTQYNKHFNRQENLGNWLNRLSTRMHRRVWEKDSVLTAAWLIRNREAWEKGRMPLPTGIDIRKAAWVLGRRQESNEWVLHRKGEIFSLDRDGWIPGETADGWSDRGSPVAILIMGHPWMMVGIRGKGAEENYAVNVETRQPMEIPVPNEGRVTLDTDHERVVIDSFTGLDWASEIRRDGYGLSAVFLDNKGERRLYWLNPGKYPVITRDKKKSKKQNVTFHLYMDKGCWLDETEFYDLLHDGFKQPGWADSIGVDHYGLYADFSIKNVVQRMRLIFPGEFMMGSPENEPERYEDEVLHKVMITRSFWLADTACTQALWQAVMGENPGWFKGAQRPVESVSWNDCQAFIEKINGLKPGLRLRLPTEAEWEYACRAGTRTPFWFGDNITPEQVNYDGNYPYAGGEKGKYRDETVEVKSLPCNGRGLYQVHGNVWEWCSDWYGDYPTGIVIDPIGPLDGSYRVLRGGSWFYYGWVVRSAVRFRYVPSFRSGSGFRLARGQKEQGKGGLKDE
jgi:formylglycine-generating enzyme required for sulfatase activity